MQTVVGLDEAGVGPLCGPLVAGAVILPDDACTPEGFDVSKLRDSKKMTEKTRKEMYMQITKHCVYGIGVIDNLEIDELGLAKCRRLVFHRALDDMFARNPEVVVKNCIVDGTMAEQYGTIPHVCIPKADDKYPCVSAASVLAKHFRDSWIYDICTSESEMALRYDWASNKGYPAPKHLKGITEYGITKYHRQSYKPCQNIPCMEINEHTGR